MAAPPEESAAIHTEGLTKAFGSLRAVDGLSMTVPRGEIFGFLGPNGAGKTTAVKMLVGLSAPTSGRAWLLGKPIGDTPTRARIGYLPELFRYQGWMSAFEVLHLHCQLADLAAESHDGEVEKALVTVGLADRAHDRVATFSKGMQQRLGLGVALLGNPEVVFLDEPTSALDPVGRKDVREIILGLKGGGITVFLNSHLLSEVQQVCDRVAVVDRGRVVASGPMQELLGENRIRVELDGTKTEALAAAAPFGVVEHGEGWLTVSGIDREQVPDLVAALVATGARISGVVRTQTTLEERFLQALER